MQNVDLLSISSAFRQWLDKGLLAEVVPTLVAIMYETNPLTLAALIDYGHTGGREKRVKPL